MCQKCVLLHDAKKKKCVLLIIEEKKADGLKSQTQIQVDKAIFVRIKKLCSYSKALS